MSLCRVQTLLLALSVLSVVDASTDCVSCNTNNCIDKRVYIVTEERSSNYCESPYKTGRNVTCSWENADQAFVKCNKNNVPKEQKYKFEVIFTESFYDNRRKNLDISSYSECLVMRGKPTMSTVIRCKTQFSITFTTTREVIIHNLHFQGCKNINIRLMKTNVTIQITNSILNGSCIDFFLKKHIQFSTYTLSIINSTFCNCHCENSSILFLSGTPRQLSVTLINVTVRDNRSPLFNSVHFSMDIELKENNYFYRNRGAFIIAVAKSSRLLFIQANVIFAKNYLEQAIDAVEEVESSPVHAENSKIIFKDSVVNFNENKGFVCSGIRAKDTQLLFKDNVTIKFTNNNGIYGGALSLHVLSKLLFNVSQHRITIDFIDNTAQEGGAIYVHDRGYNGVRSVFDISGQ